MEIPRSSSCRAHAARGARWRHWTWCGCGLYSVSSISPRHSAPARNRPAQQARPGTRHQRRRCTGRDPLRPRPHGLPHRLHRQGSGALPACRPHARRRCPRALPPAHPRSRLRCGPAFTSLNPLLFLLRLAALTWTPALKYY